MNILFICKYNRFRSKIAEAFFNKFNKSPSFKAKSAGIIKGLPISKKIFNIAKSLNLRIKGGPKGISTDLLKWSDLAIIVADDVPSRILSKYAKKLLIWKVRDADSSVKLIEKKVKQLIKKLK